MQEESKEVKICNTALGWIRSPTRISSLNDRSAAGIICRQYYNSNRQILLMSHSWPFAIVEKKMVRIEGCYDPYYPYVYEHPIDVLKVLRVYQYRLSVDESFAIELVEDEGKEKLGILAKSPNLYLSGIQDIKEDFDTFFKKYLEITLAADISIPLKASKKVQTEIVIRRLEIKSEAEQNWPLYIKNKINPTE